MRCLPFASPLASSLSQSLQQLWRSVVQGIKKKYFHFTERFWFDLQYGTNTSKVIELHDFSASMDSLAHGKAYYASWTSEVKKSHHFMMELLKDTFNDHLVIDLGCGKGKVCLVWELMNQKKGRQQTIIGIDYYQPFIAIAEANHQKVFGNSGYFIHQNVADLHFLEFKKPLIVYLFNPFDEVMLEQVLNRIGKIPAYLVYNIPMHWPVLVAHGYGRVYATTGTNQNQTTLIYTNTQA